MRPRNLSLQQLRDICAARQCLEEMSQMAAGGKGNDMLQVLRVKAGLTDDRGAIRHRPRGGPDEKAIM